jgi:hypothetical protein
MKCALFGLAFVSLSVSIQASGGSLIVAAEQDDTSELRRILYKTLQTDELKSEALMKAAAKGNLEAVKFLLGHITRDKEGTISRALDVARQNNQADTATFIAGVKLVYEAWSASIEKIKKSLREGVSINFQSGNPKIFNGATPLLAAAENGHFDTIRFLVEAGGDITIKDPFQQTVLHKLAQINFKAVRDQDIVPILQFFLDRGMNINERDLQGMTPLTWAVESDRDGVVEYLLAHGADPSIKDNLRKTALDNAQKKGNPIIIRLLAQHRPSAVETKD